MTHRTVVSFPCVNAYFIDFGALRNLNIISSRIAFVSMMVK